LDAMSCKIAGTPLVSIHETTHKVSGIHECGHFSTSVRIAVLDIPPVYTLSGGAHQSTVVDELLDEMAHVSGDPAKYSVAPTLPHGLHLNDRGDLTGVPLRVHAPRTYTFTASNTGGVAKFTQVIEVLAQKPTGFGYDGILGPNTVTWKWTAGHQYREIPHLETGNAGNATVTYAILKTSTSNSTVTPSTVANINYMGCFNDDISGQRDLPVYKGSHMSYSACKEACSGYAYFGRQYLSQCRCGNSFGSMGKANSSKHHCSCDHELQAASTTSSRPVDILISVSANCVYSTETPACGTGSKFSYCDHVLPASMLFDPATGIISGSPTAPSTEQDFIISATTTSGTTSVRMSASVIALKPKIVWLQHQLQHLENLVRNSSVDLLVSNSAGPYSEITNCSVSPALPAGLVLNEVNCRIVGKPAAISFPPARYTMTASNTGGSSKVTFYIGVRAIQPKSNMLTSFKEQLYFENIPIQMAFSMVDDSSDPIISSSVVPALPSGLNLNKTDGTVYGTPSGTSLPATYKFTVSNTGGTSTWLQNIEVGHNPMRPYRYQQDARPLFDSEKVEDLTKALGHCSATAASYKSLTKSTETNSIQYNMTAEHLRQQNGKLEDQLFDLQYQTWEWNASYSVLMSNYQHRGVALENMNKTLMHTTEVTQKLQMKLDDAQLQLLKADMQLIVIQTPSPIFEYATTFQVAARLKNWDLLSAKDDFLAESSATTCTLSLVGGSKDDIRGKLVTDFDVHGMATFDDLRLEPGKYRFALVVSGATPIMNMTDIFKVTVAATSFSHKIYGLDRVTWELPGTKEAYEASIAGTMGPSVNADDVVIKSYEFSRRSSMITVHHSVALTDAKMAHAAVKALEEDIPSGQFDERFKNKASANGVQLPSEIKSVSHTGTSSSSLSYESDNAILEDLPWKAAFIALAGVIVLALIAAVALFFWDHAALFGSVGHTQAESTELGLDPTVESGRKRNNSNDVELDMFPTAQFNQADVSVTENPLVHPSLGAEPTGNCAVPTPKENVTGHASVFSGAVNHTKPIPVIHI